MSCPQWEMTRLSKMLLTSQCWFYIYLPWSNFTKVKMLSSQYVMLFWQWFDCCVTSGRSVASYVKIMWNFVWPLTLLLSAEKRLCWCCCKADRENLGKRREASGPHFLGWKIGEGYLMVELLVGCHAGVWEDMVGCCKEDGRGEEVYGCGVAGGQASIEKRGCWSSLLLATGIPSLYQVSCYSGCLSFLSDWVNHKDAR